MTRNVTFTQPTRGLPLITVLGNDHNAIFDAVKKAIAELKDEDRASIGIKDNVWISKDEYLAILNSTKFAQ